MVKGLLGVILSFFTGLWLGLLPAQASAETPTSPPAEVILTVSGSLPGHPEGTVLSFDRAQLSALGEDSFVTNTIWTDGPQTFEGVPLRALLDHLDVQTGQLRAVASNDYEVRLAVDDVRNSSALIAMSRNGRLLSLRDKGPLWVVYPYDSDQRYQSEVYFAQSIWQLEHVEVLP
jgi:hypothetical protein